MTKRQTDLQKQLADYEVRNGRNGKPGIFLRAYNFRVATFADNSHYLQTLLRDIFDDAAAIERNADGQG